MLLAIRPQWKNSVQECGASRALESSRAGQRTPHPEGTTNAIQPNRRSDSSPPGGRVQGLLAPRPVFCSPREKFEVARAFTGPRSASTPIPLAPCHQVHILVAFCQLETQVSFVLRPNSSRQNRGTPADTGELGTAAELTAPGTNRTGLPYASDDYRIQTCSHQVLLKHFIGTRR